MRLVDIRTGATGRVVVLADGYRTNEYEAENRDGNLQCWIAAESDKKVSVQWDFKAEHEFYQVDLFVDGVFQDTCTGHSDFPAGSAEVLHDLIDEGTSIASKGTMYRHQMFFKTLSRRSSGEAITRPAMGTIELRIFYETGDKLVSPQPCDSFASYEEVLGDVFADKSTDVKSPTHGIMHDSPNLNGTRITQKNAKRKESEAFQQRPGLRPWATFKFLYRSEGMFSCVNFSLKDTELCKAALKGLGVTHMPNPDDFVIRFRSRAPPPVALSSSITSNASSNPKQSQSTETPSQPTKVPELDVSADIAIRNVIDSRRDPRLQSRNALRTGPPADVEERAQSQPLGSECSQELPKEVQAQDAEVNDQCDQSRGQARGVRTATQGSESRESNNAPEHEEEVHAEVAGEIRRENHAGSTSEGYHSEVNERDSDVMVQDSGLEKTGLITLVESRSRLAPMPADTAKPASRKSPMASPTTAPTFRSIFGTPSAIGRSKSPWMSTVDSPPVAGTPPRIRQGSLQLSETQDLSGESTLGHSQEDTLPTTPVAAKTSHDLEGSDGAQWESSTSQPPENGDGIATPDTRKRKRSTSLSDNGSEGFNQDTPEMKRRREKILSLKLELAKNIREKEEKMRRLEAALSRRNQRIADDVNKLNQELKDLDAEDLDTKI